MTGIETELSLVTYAFVAMAAFAGALIASMSGSGSSLLLAPVLLPLIGIKALLPVIAVGSLFGNIARAWVYKEWIEWKLFKKVGSDLEILFGLGELAKIPQKLLRRWTTGHKCLEQRK